MEQKLIEMKIKAIFPNAADAKDTSVTYLGSMQLEHGIDVSKVLMATSLCSDDINMPSTTFFSVLFGPFVMGGLGGLPFAGTTGMTAFANHIPDEGTGFIFYGPHIGITMNGEVGKMYRPRQDHASDSCGALMLALNRFKENPEYKPLINDSDYQQMKLEESLIKYRDKFLNAPSPIIAITEATYENIDHLVHEYLEKTKKEFKGRRVVLLGGTIINTNIGLDDYFDVKNFEVLEY